MNLTEIKAFVRKYLTETEIKAFGYDLRTREAWEALADLCKEYAVATIESIIPTKPSAEGIYDSFAPVTSTCSACDIGLAGVKALGRALTSEKAQNFYKTVAIVLVCAAIVIVLGLIEAAKQAWGKSQPQAALYWAKIQDAVVVQKPKILDRRDGLKRRIAAEYQAWVNLMLSLWQGI